MGLLSYMPCGHVGILVDDTGVNNIFLEGYMALKKNNPRTREAFVPRGLSGRA